MRDPVNPMVTLPLALLALSLSAGSAWAQMTKDQIISGLSGGSSARGIGASKPAAPPPAAAPAARPVSAAPAAQRPAAQPARPVSAPARTPATGGSAVNLTVNFPSGSAALTPGVRSSLDALGHALASSELSSFRFRIEGHTDTVGTPEENRALSQKRAEAVVSYLVSQHHIAPARLEAAGLGQDNPLVPTPPQTPEPRNRRVQVVKLDG